MKARLFAVLIAAAFISGCAGMGVQVKQDGLAAKIEGFGASNLGFAVGKKTDFGDVALQQAEAIKEILKSADAGPVAEKLIREGLLELTKRTDADPFIMMNVNEIMDLFEFKTVEGQAWTDAEKLALYGKLLDKFITGVQFGQAARRL